MTLKKCFMEQKCDVDSELKAPWLCLGYWYAQVAAYMVPLFCSHIALYACFRGSLRSHNVTSMKTTFITRYEFARCSQQLVLHPVLLVSMLESVFIGLGNLSTFTNMDDESAESPAGVYWVDCFTNPILS